VERIVTAPAATIGNNSAMYSAAQKCGDISGALRHRHDLEGTRFGAINHEVSADGPEQNREGGQVFSPVSHAGGLAEGLKRIEQFFDPAIGGVDIVRRDELPDIVQIEFRINAENVTAYARGFRRSTDLRCNRARASAGSTVSPRSSEARRRPSSSLNSASCAARAESCSSRSRRASRTTSLAEL
jgi:hypothetical protein